MRRQRDDSLAESALRGALARQPVPAGFTERVMARLREEGERVPAKRKRPWSLPRPSWRMAWALGGCACAFMLLLFGGFPGTQEDYESEQVLVRGPEQELAEVLQLVSFKWNQAREAAFSLRLDDDND